MTYFLTDTDVSGAGNFQEAEVSLAVEYTVPAGTLNAYRVRTGSAAPTNPSPQMQTYNAADGVVSGSTFSFDGAWVGPQAWWTATVTGGLHLSAGTYRMAWNTTHYCAVGGFFSGGSITRSGVTAIQGRFASGIAAPGGTSNTLYGIDIDFTADGATTPFTKDVADAYRVFNLFTKDSAESYRLFNAFSKDAAEVYRILNSWTHDFAEAYRIFAAWTTQYAESYRVFNLLQLDTVERYKVFAAWVKAIQDRYRIFSDTAPAALTPNAIADLSPLTVIAYLNRIDG